MPTAGGVQAARAAVHRMRGRRRLRARLSAGCGASSRRRAPSLY
ncbi:hypothetical protein HMPREF1550_01835 [Actinomyces sp. oral taxon 877 str. F0543]|nr:hypothetical protein HMPREF1550_01835 [Actinomyces sp. oral taxon 877 str. F0543]